MTTANPYINSTMAADRNRLKQWNIGRDDRLAGKPCSSANGAYLEGWYSIPSTDQSMAFSSDQRTLKTLIDGGRAIVGYTFLDEVAQTDYGSEIRTCFNRNRVGVHDAYVAWIHESGKPADLEVFPTYAVGSL